MKIIGFLVIDKCEEWEQPLGLNLDKKYPPGGVLEWTDDARAVFSSRKEARAAIDRTDHYRLAFGDTNMPERKNCTIVSLKAAT